MPVAHRPRLESLSQGRRIVVEIAKRQRRIVLTLAGEETRDVAAVFAQESIGLIFRMALEEQKEATVLLGESIHTGGIRAGENLIAAIHQRLFRQIVVARMRHPERLGKCSVIG